MVLPREWKLMAWTLLTMLSAFHAVCLWKAIERGERTG